MHVIRFLTIMLAALSMAMAFSHLLQLPPRLSFDGPTWITTQRVFTLYGSLGALIEVSAVVLAALCAYVVRRRSPAFQWTLAGALCLAAALGVWILFVAPANAQISQWTLEILAEDWQQWRLQWEYAHAARAFLLVLGLGTLVQSVLVETPRTWRARQ